MKILIVDDDISISELLSEALRIEGHDIQTAVNPREAFLILRELSFDLIVSDIHMPYLNGIEFGIKLREKFISTPILFFSAETDGKIRYADKVKEICNAEFIDNKSFTQLMRKIRQKNNIREQEDNVIKYMRVNDNKTPAL